MSRKRLSDSSATTLWVALCLLGFLLSGCDILQEGSDSRVELDDILPDNLPAVGDPQRLDADNDGEDEWLVFYRYKPDKQPIIAAVYRPVSLGDKLQPPTLRPWVIKIKPDQYLCQNECSVRMEDVLTQGPNGDSNPDKELIFEDKVDDKVVRASIFRWVADETGHSEEEKANRSDFEPLGHFDADNVIVKPDQITCEYEQRDRSKLVKREYYFPNASGTYYADPVTYQIKAPKEAEITLNVWPEPVSETLYPEKIVLALYQSFDDQEAMKAYVTPDAWDGVVKGCPAGVCGCYSAPSNIDRVLVEKIAYESQAQQVDAVKEIYEAKIVVQVICVSKGGQPERANTVVWSARKSPTDETWLLSNVVPGPEDYFVSVQK